MNLDLSVSLAGVNLEHPIMNAGGTCKRLEGEEGVEGFLKTMVSAVVIGSITVEPRDGNSGNVYSYQDPFSLNSLGMPNPGLKYWQEHLPEAVRRCNEAGKALVMNVAGFNASDYVDLTEMALGGGADIVEENLGCPNVVAGNVQKPVISFDFDLVEEIMLRVTERVGADARVAFKVSPFSDPSALKRMAAICNRYAIVKALVTTNTFPNGFAFGESLKPIITPNNGFGGVGGPAMFGIGLGQVVQFRAALDDRIQVVGVGGISTGKNVRDYLLAKAAAVQVATACIERKGRVFNVLLDELIAVSSVPRTN